MPFGLFEAILETRKGEDRGQRTVETAAGEALAA
jgi:hypothetical protein